MPVGDWSGLISQIHAEPATVVHLALVWDSMQKIKSITETCIAYSVLKGVDEIQINLVSRCIKVDLTVPPYTIKLMF